MNATSAIEHVPGERAPTTMMHFNIRSINEITIKNVNSIVDVHSIVTDISLACNLHKYDFEDIKQIVHL